jgi:UPF0271 protein
LFVRDGRIELSFVGNFVGSFVESEQDGEGKRSCILKPGSTKIPTKIPTKELHEFLLALDYLRAMRLDLNCDLGEGEPPARTRALMRCITSANVACGGHAGTLETMNLCARLARDADVRLGAHPGPWNRGDFGRAPATFSPEELEMILLHQVSALEQVARAASVPLHHVKLHGALYHACDANEAMARRYLKLVARWWPGAKVYARCGGRVARLGPRAGVEVWGEAFLDRGYQEDGLLVPRSEPGALLEDPGQVGIRLRSLLERRGVLTVSGRRLPLVPRTVCLHGDTPGAEKLARVVSTILRAARPSGRGDESLKGEGGDK